MESLTLLLIASPLLSPLAEGSSVGYSFRYVHGRTEPSCYKFVRTSYTWVQAKENCQRLGGNLVTIQTAGEQNHLTRLLGHIFPKLDELKHLSKLSYWTGGNDLHTKGDWRWLADNHQFTYKGWSPGEPNSPGVECCLSLAYTYKWRWNDGLCAYKMGSICEIAC